MHVYICVLYVYIYIYLYMYIYAYICIYMRSHGWRRGSTEPTMEWLAPVALPVHAIWKCLCGIFIQSPNTYSQADLYWLSQLACSPSETGMVKKPTRSRITHRHWIPTGFINVRSSLEPIISSIAYTLHRQVFHTWRSNPGLVFSRHCGKGTLKLELSERLNHTSTVNVCKVTDALLRAKRFSIIAHHRM